MSSTAQLRSALDNLDRVGGDTRAARATLNGLRERGELTERVVARATRVAIDNARKLDTAITTAADTNRRLTKSAHIAPKRRSGGNAPKTSIVMDQLHASVLANRAAGIVPVSDIAALRRTK